MKEHDFIKTIKDITKSEFLGDDCAFLEKFGLVITQDNFVENIHFKTEWATPFQIGYKAAVVNISDVLASGAKPEYITVGLSMPDLGNEFVKELYSGIQEGAYGAQVIGGDITGGEKIFISICAIGSSNGRKISSRKNAKPGYVVITSNEKFGISSLGLKELEEGKRNTENIKVHLEPKLNFEFSKEISMKIREDYAMMDTSDGLSDALFQIAQASGVTIRAENIPGMFGAEDYNLVAAVPEKFLDNLKDYRIIGRVEKYSEASLVIDDKKYKNYNELGLYNHFKG